MSFVVREMSSLALYGIKSYFFELAGHNKEDVNRILTIIEKQGTQGELEHYDFILNIGAVIVNNLLSSLLKIPSWMFCEHIVVDLPDGGQSCAKIFYPTDAAKQAYEKKHLQPVPGLWLFPGVNQNDTSFVHLECEFVKLGWIVIVVNRRGLCCQLKNHEFNIAGSHMDTYAIITKVMKQPRLQNRKMVAIGVSMGGNALSAYLSNHLDRKHDGIIAAATICSPLHARDVRPAESWMNESLASKFVELYITPYMDYDYEGYSEEEINRIKRIRHRIKNSTNIYEIMFLNLVLLDNPEGEPKNQAFTDLVKEFGWDRLQEMITHNDPRVWQPFLHHTGAHKFHEINVPILAIHAKNDIIVSLSEASKQSILSCPYAIHLLTNSGSHCYFRNSLFDYGNLSWIDQLVCKFFELKLAEEF